MSSASLAEHVAVVGLGSTTTPVFDAAAELQDAGVHDAASARAALERHALTDVCVFFPGRGERAPDGFEELTHTLGGAALAPKKDRRADEPCFCIRHGSKPPVGSSSDGQGNSTGSDGGVRNGYGRAPIAELAAMESDPRASSGPRASAVSRAPPGFELVFKSPGGRDADLNRCLRSAGFGVPKASAAAAPPLFLVLRRLGAGLDGGGGAGDGEVDRFHQRGVSRPLMELGLLRARAVRSGMAPWDAAAAAGGAPFLHGDGLTSYEPAEELPSGWGRMARPLPIAVGQRSAGDWSVGAFLAFRRAPAAGLCDLCYAPELLLHYPEGRAMAAAPATAHTEAQGHSQEPGTAPQPAATPPAAFALPAAELPLFCFPYGCELRRCSIDELPSPRVFSFALTLADGAPVFATCLMAHEQVGTAQMAQLEAQLPRADTDSFTGTGSGTANAHSSDATGVGSPSQLRTSSKVQALLGLGATADAGVSTAETTHTSPSAAGAGDQRTPDSHQSLLPQVYAQVCVVLLTQLPWLENHRALLAQLHQRAQFLAGGSAKGGAIRAGAWVARVLQQLHRLRAPAPGRQPLLVQLAASSSGPGPEDDGDGDRSAAANLRRPCFRYAQTAAHDLPLLDLRLQRLFGCLTPRAVVHILALLLRECRVVLLSRSHSLPSDCTLLLRSLLFPCQWQGASISRLPYALWDFLDMPGACLVGITARPCGSGQSSSFGVADVLRACEAPGVGDGSAQEAALYVVDLDSNLVASHRGSICFDADLAHIAEATAAWLPSMPPCLHEPLVRKLEWACVHFGVKPSFETRIDVDTGPVLDVGYADGSSDVDSRERGSFNFEVVVRCAVLQMHARLLKNYQQFLTPPTVATVRQDEWSGSAEDWFDVDAFVASRESADVEEAAFVRTWSGTQMFAHLVHDLTESSSRDESLLFFEQFCAKDVSADATTGNATDGDYDDTAFEERLRRAVSKLDSCRQRTQGAGEDTPAVCIGSPPQAAAGKTSQSHGDRRQGLDSPSTGALQSWWQYVHFADTGTDSSAEQMPGESAANRACTAPFAVDPRTVSAYPACRSPQELLLADEKLQSIEGCGPSDMGAHERSLTLRTLATSLRELHEGGLRRKTTADTPSRRASKTKKGAYLETELNDCWDATLSSGSDDDNPAAAAGVVGARASSGASATVDGGNGDSTSVDQGEAVPSAAEAGEMRRLMEPQERLDALLLPARMCLRDVYGSWFLLLPRWFASKASCEHEFDGADTTAMRAPSTIATVCVVEMALGAVQRMRRTSVQPDEAMYRALLWTCGQSGPRFSRDAVGLFKEMRNDGITPNVLTYGLYSRSVVNYHRFFRRKQVESARAVRSQVEQADMTRESMDAPASTDAPNVSTPDSADEATRQHVSTDIRDGRAHDLVEDFVGTTDYQLNELQGLGTEWRRSVRTTSATHRQRAPGDGPECAGSPVPALPAVEQRRTLWTRATSVFRSRGSAAADTSSTSALFTLQQDQVQQGDNNSAAHRSGGEEGASKAPLETASDPGDDTSSMPSIADLHPAEETAITSDTVPAVQTEPKKQPVRVVASTPVAPPATDTCTRGVSTAPQHRVLAMWLESPAASSASKTADWELEEQATARWLSARSTGTQPTLCTAIGTVYAFREAQVSGSSRAAADQEDRGSSAISHYRSEYLSSMQLRRQLEALVQRLGNSVLDGPQLHGAHARLYWNLIWHCSRVSLPVPLARCFAPLHPRSDATDGGFAHGQALPISVIVTSSRARAFEWAARFRSRTTGPPRSALSCVRGMGESEGALYQSEEDRDFEAAGLAAVLSALCSPVRPVEQAVTCFLSLRKDARARKGRAQGVPNASSVSVFERPVYLVLLRIVQGFNIMNTVLPTNEEGITALPGQHSGVMSERVLLPAFEQAFVDTLATGASGGLGADCWHQFDWDQDVPAISMAAIASRSMFGAL